MKILSCLFLLCLICIGCDVKQPEFRMATANIDYNVDLLFDHDGCKVYRFEDADRYVYYTDCRKGSDISSSTTYGYSVGKSTRTAQVETKY